MSPLIFQPAASEFLLFKQMNQGPISTQTHLCGSVNGPFGVNLRDGKWYLKAFGKEERRGR